MRGAAFVDTYSQWPPCTTLKSLPYVTVTQQKQKYDLEKKYLNRRQSQDAREEENEGSGAQ